MWMLRYFVSLALVLLSSVSLASASLGPFVLDGRVAENAFMRDRLSQTYETFREYFGDVGGEILVTAAGLCLRTGYNFEEHRVAFCSGAATREGGIHSPDIISHEGFHALLCARFPAFCASAVLKNEAAVALHEGLADYFAFTLDPDDRFGEEMYIDRLFVREYRTSLCYSLTAGKPVKGNAIVSWFIYNNVSWADIVKILTSEAPFIATSFAHLGEDNYCLSADGPDIALDVNGFEPSSLQRYRLPKEQVSTVVLRPNVAFKARFGDDVTIVWSRASEGERKSVFTITEPKPWIYEIVPSADSGWEKFILEIRGPSGLLGIKVLYLSISVTR